MTIKFNKETLAERVILRPFVETVSKGGIVISRDSRSQAINTDKGEVFMIGPSAWFDLPKKPELKVGDKVYYSHYGAKLLEKDGDMYIICNDSDILVGYSDE